MHRTLSGLFVAGTLGTLALGGCTGAAPDRYSGYTEAEFFYVAAALSGRLQALA